MGSRAIDAQHGKDTVAGVLTRELGYNRVGLADQIRAALLELDPIVKQYPFPKHPDRLANIVALQGWDVAKKEPEVRRLLHIFGTEVGRAMMGEDVWIAALVRATKGFYGAERKIVIPDIRFPNEAAWIQRMNDAELWKVTRPDFDNGVGVTHASERHIPTLRADLEFINVGSLANLQDVVLRGIKNRMAILPLGDKA